jgi:glycosyltransferase involved in cell wall biosynthesis
VSVTAIVLTFNEEIHIERCLRSAGRLAQRLIVVDSFSSDSTLGIARSLGAEVVQRCFKNQADQFQWALDTLDIRTDWVLRLDADEYLEDALIVEILERLPTVAPEVAGIDFKRKFIFMEHWIKWGGYYPTVLTRMWRTGRGQIEQRWMDEHVVLSLGTSVLFARGDLVDDNLNGLSAWVDKHNRYATRQMIDYLNLEYGLFPMDKRLEAKGNRQARRKRYLRNVIFGKAPLYVRSALYYLLRYIFRFGFLDGRPGFVFHMMHGFWYFVLIDAKIEEGRTAIRRNGLAAFRRRLVGTYGIELPALSREEEPH